MYKFVIINAEDVSKINFTEVEETGPEHMRHNNDRSKTFVKYSGDQPECLFQIAGNAMGLPEQSYNEMLDILNTSEWAPQDSE